MNLQQLIRILFARWKLIVAMTVIGALLGLGYALTMRSMFNATAQVLVTVRTPDTIGQAAVSDQMLPDYLSTQADVIRSDRVAQAAVQSLGLASNPEAIANYRASNPNVSISQYYADQIRSGLRVTTLPQSRVIAITYFSLNPVVAAQMATAVANAYRDVSLDLQVEPARQSAGWYDRTAADIRTKLEDAQAKLDAKQKALGITADQDTTDSEVARLSALSTQLAGIQAQRATVGSRTSAGALPDAMMSPVVQSLQSDIARLEAQRRQLATTAGPNNIDYQQLVTQIGALRQQLATQQGLIARATATSSSQVASSERELAGAVAAQKQRVMAARASRGEVASLAQDVANLRATYEQFVAKRSQINLLGTGGQTNVSMLSPATVPEHPSGLSRKVVVLAALIAGFVLGAVLSLVLEFFDQRVRNADDTEIWLGIPNLGGVHAIGGPSLPALAYMPRRFLPGRSSDAA